MLVLVLVLVLLVAELIVVTLPSGVDHGDGWSRRSSLFSYDLWKRWGCTERNVEFGPHVLLMNHRMNRIENRCLCHLPIIDVIPSLELSD